MDSLVVEVSISQRTFSVLGTTLTETSSWDNLEQGMYNVAKLGTGAPSGAYQWGLLVVFASDNATKRLQMYFPSIAAAPFFRCYGSGTWYKWQQATCTTVDPIAAS